MQSSNLTSSSNKAAPNLINQLTSNNSSLVNPIAQSNSTKLVHINQNHVASDNNSIQSNQVTHIKASNLKINQISQIVHSPGLNQQIIIQNNSSIAAQYQTTPSSNLASSTYGGFGNILNKII